MTDAQYINLALRLARRAYGATSPNPMVGAVLVKGDKIIGQGWHHSAGLPHAEIEALRNAEAKGNSPKGATLFVTLEPCCTHGRTPPCTEAIIAAGIKRVVVGTTDPNPAHAGKAFRLLRRAGVEIVELGKVAPLPQPSPPVGAREKKIAKSALRRRARSDAPYQKLSADCAQLNEAFNHWIVRRTPFVTVKAAMTLDGKIATARGESKWITGEAARAYGMKLRQGSDAILVGVNTVVADDPSLTARQVQGSKFKVQSLKRRIILDPQARTPLKAKVVSDEFAGLTTIVVTKAANKQRVAALAKRVNVLLAPSKKYRISNLETQIANFKSQIDLRWLLKKLGRENITSLLVEGGGEANAAFLLGGFAQRVAFFYAPKVLGGRAARKGVGGEGIQSMAEMIKLREVEWHWLGVDLLLTGLIV